MVWILKTGSPWRDLPGHFGAWQSVYSRFRRWTQQGVWARVLDKLTEQQDSESYLIDATIVRAHQDATGAKRGAPGHRPISRRANHKDSRCCGRLGKSRSVLANSRTSSRHRVFLSEDQAQPSHCDAPREVGSTLSGHGDARSCADLDDLEPLRRLRLTSLWTIASLDDRGCWGPGGAALGELRACLQPALMRARQRRQ